jgi:hypothetical protein
MRTTTNAVSKRQTRAAGVIDRLGSFDLFTFLVGGNTVVMAAVSGGALASDMPRHAIFAGVLALATLTVATLRRK